MGVDDGRLFFHTRSELESSSTRCRTAVLPEAVAVCTDLFRGGDGLCTRVGVASGRMPHQDNNG